MSHNLKKNKKGGLATIVAVMIGILLLVVSFVMYMNLNITTMKYSNMTQYGKDSLLKLESTGIVEKTYLLNIKSDLSGKLNMQTGETFNIFIQVGNGVKYNVNLMPDKIISDYGDNIQIELVYNYNKKVFGLVSTSIRPTFTIQKEDMIVSLSTTSKNRRTSDD